MSPSELITPPSKAALTFLREMLGKSKASSLSFFMVSVAHPVMRQISVVMPKIYNESEVETIFTTHFSKLDEFFGLAKCALKEKFLMSLKKIHRKFIENKVIMINIVMIITAISAFIFSIFVNINYGKIAFPNIPHADDWAFIDKLRSYRELEITLFEYIFTLHNGHPAVPARIAFLFSETFFNLNLEWLRWSTLLLQYFCMFFAVSIILIPYMKIGCLCNNNLRGIAASEILSPILFALICIIFIFTSLIGWETFSYAMGIANIFAVTAAIGSIAIFQTYLIFSKSKIILAVSMVLALVSTFSMAQGVFVWLVLAIAGILRSRRENAIMSVGFGVIFVFSITFFIISRGNSGSDIGSLTQLPVRTLGLLGLPWFPDIPNTIFHVNIRILIGVLVCIALWWLSLGAVSGGGDFFQSNAIAISVLIFGGLTILAILASRGSFDLPSLLAPRYAQLLLPVALGLVAMALAASTRGGGGQLILSAIGSVAFIGWSLSISIETMMAPHRAFAYERMENYILNGDPTNSEVIRDLFYLDDFYASKLFPSSVDYMRMNDLGPFTTES